MYDVHVHFTNEIKVMSIISTSLCYAMKYVFSVKKTNDTYAVYIYKTQAVLASFDKDLM